LVAYVHCIELSSVQQRATSGSVMQCFFACGLCLAASFAIVFPDWRQLYFITALPTGLFIISWWWIPESPKWLANQLRSGKLKGGEKLQHSRAETADQHRALLHVAEEARDVVGDGGSEDEKGHRNLTDKGDKEFTYSMLLKDSDTSQLLMTVCVVWLIGGFVYYGITLSAGSISKEIHLNMFLMGLVEIPAYILSRYLADTAGRKSSYISMTLLAAFFCLVSWSYPRKGGRLLFALVGKIFASGAFSLVWMWSPEIFPTGARSLTTAIGSQAARVGSILAPYVVVLMSEMESTVDGSGVSHPPLPQPIFAAVGCISAFVACFLPETVGIEMI